MKKIAQQQEWKDALKAILREDLEAFKEVDGTYEDWANEIFSGNIPDAAYALLEEGDQKFGVEEASQMFKDVCDSLNLKHAAGSLKRKANFDFAGRSLRSIESELEAMELKGQEDTPRYKALSEYADMLADKKNLQEDKSRLEQAEQDEQDEQVERTTLRRRRILERAPQIQAAYDRLSQTEWERLVKKHYPIRQFNSNAWIVESLAKDWSPNDPKAWMFASEAEAQLKVLQLVKTRYNDYYLRTDKPTQRPPRDIEGSLRVAKKKKKSSKPKKVTEIADAIQRDRGVDEVAAHKMAWETYCSYVNPSYDGCTSKGKSKRKSPKSARD
jgi:hypothetical protein